MYDCKMNEELMKCTTLAQMLVVIAKYYDTDNCKPGQIGKQMFIAAIPNALNLVGAKKKANV